MLYRGSPNFFQVRTIFVTDWAQKNHLAKLVLKCSVFFQGCYIEAAQNDLRRDNFCNRFGTKKITLL